VSVRRERPPTGLSGNSIRLRLPDGTVKEMPLDTSPGPPSGLCCFCGQGVEGSAIRVSAGWTDGGGDHLQSWAAHRTCLAERLHDSVAGAGPFFAG